MPPALSLKYKSLGQVGIAFAPVPFLRSSPLMDLRSLRHAVAGMGLPEPPKECVSTEQHNSLRNYLDGPLQNVDGARVFTVHGLRKLGFNSKKVLEEHFSTYGLVTNVFVTRVSSKAIFPGAPPRKVRAGNFGIVVMNSEESVSGILADANLHVVQNVPLRVDAFVAQRSTENNETLTTASVLVSALDRSPQPQFINLGHDDQFQRRSAPQSTTQERSPQPQFKFNIGHDDHSRWSAPPSTSRTREVPEAHAPEACFREASMFLDEFQEQGKFQRQTSFDSTSMHPDEFQEQGKFQRQNSPESTSSNFSDDLPGKFSKQTTDESTAASTAQQHYDDPQSGEIHEVVTRLMAAGETFPAQQDVGDYYHNPKKAAVISQIDRRSAQEILWASKIAQNMMTEAGRLCAEAQAAQRLRDEAESIRLACVLQSEQSACNAILLTSEARALASQAEAEYAYALSRPPPLPPARWLPNATQQNSFPPGLLEQNYVPLESKHNGTLSDHLVEVSEADPRCVFVVRQIHKFGFQSCELLRRHYSHYGTVHRVLVADKRVKCFPGSTGERKTRPGGMGLIIMDDAGSTSRILSAGCEQLVFGNMIVVQPYDDPNSGTCVLQQMSL